MPENLPKPDKSLKELEKNKHLIDWRQLLKKGLYSLKYNIILSRIFTYKKGR